MGYLEIVGAGIIWASMGPLLKILQTNGFTPWDIVLGRSALSASMLGLYLLVRTGILGPVKREEQGFLLLSAQDAVSFLLLGLLAVVFSQTAYFYALANTSIAVAVTLNYTAPFFVMILSFLVYKEPVTRAKGLALVGAVTGTALTSGFIGSESVRQGMSAMGIAAGILSGLSYGLQTLVYKRVGRKYGPIPLNFWTMTFGATNLCLILTFVNKRAPGIFQKLALAPKSVWLIFLLAGLGPGTLAFILFADGINKVDATKGSIMAMSEPVAACLLGYLVLKETLALTQVLGVALVLASIWAVSIPEARRKTLKDAVNRTPDV